MLDKKELIMEGLACTVVGMIVVFAVLIIIMLVIKAMALFSKDEQKSEQAVPTAAPVAKAEGTLVQITEIKDDSVIIAVITAAIAAMSGKSATGFRIRSYKKISDGEWNKAGRREVLDNRI